MGWKLSDITQFHDPSSKPSGSHGWASVWRSFGSLFSWLKYSKKWIWAIENEKKFQVFSKLENWNSVASSVNKMRLWAPKQVHCHIHLRLWVITVGTPLFHFISTQNFMQKFSLFSFSLPSSSQRASSMAPHSMIKSLNQAWIFTGESTKLYHRVHTSLSLSQVQMKTKTHR